MRTVFVIENGNGGYITQLWAEDRADAMRRYNLMLNEPVDSCRHQEWGYAWPRRARADTRYVKMRVLADGLHAVPATTGDAP